MKLEADTSLAVMQASQGDLQNRALNAKSIKDKDLQYIEDAAKDFEAMYMAEMMKPMFEGLKTDSRFGGGKGEEIFRGFMIEEYGKLMAERGDIGIADAVKAEMIRMQEAANNPRSELNP
jgi:Rod binding domain-containing protein